MDIGEQIPHCLILLSEDGSKFARNGGHVSTCFLVLLDPCNPAENRFHGLFPHSCGISDPDEMLTTVISYMLYFLHILIFASTFSFVTGTSDFISSKQHSHLINKQTQRT